VIVTMTPFQELVRSRVSIRRFLPQPVEREKIEACLEAARLAPSAENAQTWRFLVLDDADLRARFSREVFSGIYTRTRFAAEAPVLILILAKPDFLANRLGRQIQKVSFFLIDIGIAGEHLVLQAEELGLGTCWIGWFHMRRARRFFRIPRKYKIVALLAMGYPAKRPSRERSRKPLDQIAFFNEFEG